MDVCVWGGGYQHWAPMKKALWAFPGQLVLCEVQHVAPKLTSRNHHCSGDLRELFMRTLGMQCLLKT